MLVSKCMSLLLDPDTGLTKEVRNDSTVLTHTKEVRNDSTVLTHPREFNFIRTYMT
jgi:hypothetical protein